MKQKDKDHQWFQMYAVRDRVTGKDLPNNAPISDVAKIPLHTSLPSVEECDHIRAEFEILIARVISEKMEYFHPLKPVVPQHMKHKYSDSMRLKSEIVSTACLCYIQVVDHVYMYKCLTTCTCTLVGQIQLPIIVTPCLQLNCHYITVAGGIGCTYQIGTSW